MQHIQKMLLNGIDQEKKLLKFMNPHLRIHIFQYIANKMLHEILHLFDNPLKLTTLLKNFCEIKDNLRVIHYLKTYAKLLIFEKQRLC